MPSNPHRPGIMLVNPRLKTPSPDSAATFLRWTKLHFRDLLNIPSHPTHGRLTRCLRFVVPDDNNDTNYSHTNPETLPPYLYTCHIDDIGIVQSQAYYDVSRKLDLESTRDLGEGEEKVGREGMVFDIVDAEFAIYEEMTESMDFYLYSFRNQRA